MASPQNHLPASFNNGEISDLLMNLSSPVPLDICPLKATAAFHIIYVLTYSPETLESWLSSKSIKSTRGHPTQLILRVSGNHIEKIKTENEVAILSWLHTNSTIPIPSVVAYDSTLENSLGREFILMTRETGECLADIHRTLSTADMDSILDQLIDFQVQLHAEPWSHIGGLCFSGQGEKILPGPVLEETFWFIPDIEHYWPVEESFETLNISGPFHSYVEYISAHIRNYIHAIKIHSSLEFMRDTLPQLESFLGALTINAEILNRVVLRLAHKDLHYANILVDKEGAQVTAILDWEFAGVVPYTRWNPSRAFLWNTQDTDEALNEKAYMVDKYVRRVKQRGFGYLVEDARFSSPKQENMQVAANFLRAIVEVSPRGEKRDAVMGWKESMLDAIGAFDA